MKSRHALIATVLLVVAACAGGDDTGADGSEQLTVNGMPLYRYIPDLNPGDTSGQNVGGVWFVVDANGSVIGGPEASTDTTAPDSDDRDY
ncbi:MAG: hypothetical protein ACFCU2_02195 [Acidimicrobiia bacterium]